MVGSVPRKCFRFSGCSATKSAADWLACTPITLAALGGAPACQARAHFLQRFPRPSWLRTALWVGKLTDSRFCDSAFVWSEPLKWHTILGTVSGKGTTGGEKEILPEISANGCRTDGDLRRCR